MADPDDEQRLCERAPGAVVFADRDSTTLNTTKAVHLLSEGSAAGAVLTLANARDVHAVGWSVLFGAV